MRKIGTRGSTSSWRLTVVALAAAVGAIALLPGCSDSKKDTPADAKATITGRLVGVTGLPIPEASICTGAATVGTTGAGGEFSVRVAPGAQHLTFSKDGALLAESCLAVAELTTYALGDISAYTASACAALAGGEGDADGDGLADADEVNGWEVLVTDGDGVVHGRRVTSDQALADTDFDGLSDAEERAAGTDPRRKDTDGDLLSDFGELNVFKSDPRSMDSDGDSRGPDGKAPTDPNLWDGNELLRSHTSPTLADTDGDGFTDWQEIHSGGTNPLVADLPALALEAYGDPLVQLDVQSVSGCNSSSVTLAQDTTEQKDTDLTTTKMSIENTVKLHTEAEVGTSNWPPSANAKLTTDTEFKQAWMHEGSSSFTQTSVNESKKQAECWETAQVSFANGKIGTAMKLRNLSDLSFKVRDLNVIAYQLQGGGRLSLIGTLDPVSWPTGGFVLGPSGEIVFEAKKADLGAETMKALVKTPSALIFQVGSYALFQLDEWGVNETVNYAKLGETAVQRTGLLTVDTGDGPAERYLVATNVYRTPDGAGRGVTMKEALAILGIPYETEPQKDANGAVVGPRLLKRVRGVAAYADDPLRGRGFWAVAGTGAAFDPDAAATDFDGIVLRDGERVTLAFMRDTDKDGIFDREEALLGTDPAKPDTDDDGLSDYDESKVGWVVEAAGRSYQVYPDGRFADYDGDYLPDGAEKGAGTDPFRKDTDGDGALDPADSDPLNPPCLTGGSLGMIAWWDGGTTVAPPTPGPSPNDSWTIASPGQPVARASNAALVGGATITLLGGDYVFNVNQTADLNGQYLEAPNDDTLNPNRTVSLSAWVNRNALSALPDWSTVVAKGPWTGEHYALYVDRTGRVAFVLSRSVHKKCWYCWFGSACDDASCADSNYNERSVAQTTNPVVENAKWTLVTATFGGEMMRVYVNGVQVASYDTSVYWADGWYRYETTTNWLITNTAPLRIGASATGVAPFNGMLDDVQLAGAGWTPNQASLQNTLGVCRALQ